MHDRLRQTAVIALLTCALAACGDDEAAPRPPAPEAPAEATDEPAAAPDEPVEEAAASAPAASAPGTRRPEPAEARSARAALREAREAGQRDPTAGLAAFERLIGAHPDNPRLRCEAGYLAHRAGDDERAHELLESGRRLFGSIYDVPPALRVPVAMCLYNTGLVAEARDRTHDARVAYERSLRLRPNAVVERRFAALAPPTLPERVAADSLEAIFAEPEADEDGASDDGGGPSVRVMGRRAPSEGVPELALLQVGYDEELIIEQTVQLAVRDGDGYRLFTVLTDTDDMTDHGNTDMVSLGDGTVEVVATDAGPIVRATFEHGHVSGADGFDGECSYGYSHTSNQRIAVLCTLEPLLCRPLTLAHRVSESSSYRDCDGEDEPEESGEDEPPSWARELTIDADGTTHLRTVSGRPPAPPVEGDRPIGQLLRALYTTY